MQDFTAMTEYYGQNIAFYVRPFKKYYAIELDERMMSIIRHNEHWEQFVGNLPDEVIAELIKAIERRL